MFYRVQEEKTDNCALPCARVIAEASMLDGHSAFQLYFFVVLGVE
jgi:hypothetical protein